MKAKYLYCTYDRYLNKYLWYEYKNEIYFITIPHNGYYVNFVQEHKTEQDRIDLMIKEQNSEHKPAAEIDFDEILNLLY